MHYDIFNGDADGIIALLQLRLAQPKQSTLITGVKRDIKLLEKLLDNQQEQPLTAEDSVTVLDISMEKNIAALETLLNCGVDIFYADHHRSGDIPKQANLTAHIDLNATTCTSLIINKLLKGRYILWAIAAAYGDNMIAVADELTQQQGLNSEQKNQLKLLGTLLNYNGYGADISDLHFHPADLFTQLLSFSDPFKLIADKNSVYHQLKDGYDSDMALVNQIDSSHNSEQVQVFHLPDEAWARRVSGVFANELANLSPDSAHIIVTKNTHLDDCFTLSLRAPLNNRQGAGEICSQYDTGGGREAAAGVNALPTAHLSQFISQVEDYYRH